MSNQYKRKYPAFKEENGDDVEDYKKSNKKSTTKHKRLPSKQKLITNKQDEMQSEISTMDESELIKNYIEQQNQNKGKFGKQIDEESTASSYIFPFNDSFDQGQISKCKENIADEQTKNDKISKDNIDQKISKPSEIFECKYKPKEISFRDKEKNEIKNFLLRQIYTSPFVILLNVLLRTICSKVTKKKKQENILCQFSRKK